METLFDQTHGTDHYKVCSEDGKLHLYRNGVCHSRWNPDEPLSGCIWDLMMLPALHSPENSLKNVLILGFGAGAVALKLKRLVKPERIVGIESDPVHLDIAEKIFESAADCELFQTDANEWVQAEVSKHNVATFDLIIDDLYSEVDVRGVPLNLEWYKKLAQLASPDSTLVFNLTTPGKYIPCLQPFLEDPLLCRKFPHLKALQVEESCNGIIAFSSKPFDEVVFRNRLNRISSNYPKCEGVAGNYSEFDFTEESK